MFMAFIYANGILLASMFATIYFSEVLPGVLRNMGLFEWLSVIVSGILTNVIVRHLYDVLIPQISNSLSPTLINWIFGVASATSLTLICLAANGMGISISQQIQNSPLIILISAILLVMCIVEAWEMQEGSNDQNRFINSIFGGLAMFCFAFLAPLFVLKSFVDLYNAGFASFVSGWAAGLSSRFVKQISSKAVLEAQATKKIISGFFEKDFPIVLAVVGTYIAFKVASINSIYFALAVGVVSALLGFVISHIALEEQ